MQRPFYRNTTYLSESASMWLVPQYFNRVKIFILASFGCLSNNSFDKATVSEGSENIDFFRAL